MDLHWRTLNERSSWTQYDGFYYVIVQSLRLQDFNVRFHLLKNKASPTGSWKYFIMTAEEVFSDYSKQAIICSLYPLIGR